jgi:hypothetical protein
LKIEIGRIHLVELKEYLDGFKVFIKTEKGISWIAERYERNKLFKNLLNVDKISELDENNFRVVIKSLWATGFWTNKDYMFNNLIKNNGMDLIADSLFDILYSDKFLQERYDTFIGKINGIGPSIITEILTFVDPMSYCIWNEKPKKVLPFLGMEGLLTARIFKNQIKGSEYAQIVDILSQFKDHLELVFDNPNFLDVDLFFAYLFYEVIPKESVKQILVDRPIVDETLFENHEINPINNHSGAQKSLIELGNLMGYDTYIPPEDRSKKINDVKLEEHATLRELPPFTLPDLMETVKHIDVLWLKNEFPVFGFEIEESTDVTKGLLRLYHIRNLNIKPIIVGPITKEKKFDLEIKKEPFNRIRDIYKFVSYPELSKLLEITKNYNKIRKNLLGI